MSLSVIIEGVAEEDDCFRKMKKVKEACDDAGINYPDDLEEYLSEFCTEEEVMRLRCDIPYTGEVMYGDGAIINVDEIPEGVTQIRVRCS